MCMFGLWTADVPHGMYAYIRHQSEDMYLLRIRSLLLAIVRSNETKMALQTVQYVSLIPYGTSRDSVPREPV